MQTFQLDRHSSSRVRATLLESTPLGTPYQEVLTFVQDRGWRYTVHEGGERDTKSSTIEAEYDKFWGCPWWDTVEAYWKFDEQNRLKEINIQIISDAP